MRSLGEPVEQLLINVFADKFDQIGSDFRLEFLACHFLSADSDDGERIGQKILFRQIIKRGKKFSLGQIAGRTENNHRAGIGLFLYFAHKNNMQQINTNERGFLQTPTANNRIRLVF